MQRLRIALAVVVTVVWLAGYIIAYTGSGEPPKELSGLMAVVLGWAFAGTIKDTLSKRSKDDDD